MSRTTFLAAAVLFVAVALRAQTLSSSDNAALRYWQAFAEMQDPSADKSTQNLLERVASAAAAWDEQQLGKIVEQNTAAIETMQRATRLPECNWGLDYELGPATPVAHLAKARVLARLNVLYGMRQTARGDNSGAVETWLAGLRFAQHLAQGASLIGALTAKAALLADLNALRGTIAAGSLDDAAATRIGDAVRGLPQYGVDWGSAILMESAADAIALNQFAKSSDPRKFYEEGFGEAMPASGRVPSPTEIAQFQDLMVEVAKVFQREDAAPPEIAVLEARIRHLNPVIDRMTPSLARVSDYRRETGRARQEVLEALAARRR